MVIEICDFPIHLYLGYYSHERAHQQEVIVSLWVHCQIDEVADNLEATVNYETLFDCLRALNDARVQLIETLLERLASRVLAVSDKIVQVKVQIEKQALPHLLCGSSLRLSKEYHRS